MVQLKGAVQRKGKPFISCRRASLVLVFLTSLICAVMMLGRIPMKSTTAFWSAKIDYAVDWDPIISEAQPLGPRVLIRPSVTRPWVVLALTKSKSFMDRQRTRDEHRPKSVQVVFPVGLVANDTAHTAALEAEAEIYGDLLLMDFEDRWETLVRKTFGSLKWFYEETTFNDSLVFKVDDDVVINWPALSGYVHDTLLPTGWKSAEKSSVRLVQRDPLYLGFGCLGAVINKDPHDRYYEPQLDAGVFPDYVNGPLIMMNRVTVEAVLKELPKQTTYVRNDDALIGILADRANVSVIHCPDRLATRHPFGHADKTDLRRLPPCSDWWWAIVDKPVLREAFQTKVYECAASYNEKS
eukprot:Protomagalhaensia_sp_Gyna_25__2132@NODE_2152_length_1257_cov_10_403120_g1777_i0_p1_GENE_NODE_2152_length_1257_cov_10_403120_g1777_i0NODE_2152_length_1257_cov_10_403120_g1777_i0_p1_ORF_typecomplete_len353_score45_70Galactosyl_T/PF01762_21/4_1e29Fringe/PF02434_16/0_15DUF3333/PF11812_8/0_18DUF3333/PF11812_8/7_4e03_NODE_2152_length_1257_cov_10_403120_g1777_i01691227